MSWFEFISFESLALTAVIIVLMRCFLQQKWKFFAEKSIPTDVPSILNFGTMGWPSGQKLFTIDNERKRRLGLVYGVYAAWNPILVIHDLEIMKQIYTKEFKNFPDRQTIFSTLHGKEMNHGLTAVSQNKWKRIRNALSPTFSILKLKQTFFVIDECATQTVAVLQKKCEADDGIFVPRIIFSNLALDVIISAALGTKANTQTLDGEETRLAMELRKSFKFSFRSFLAIAIVMFPSLEPIYYRLGYTIFPKSSTSYVANLINAVINKRKKAASYEIPKDLLQLMLDAAVDDKDINEESTKGLTRDEVVGNAMLMVGAGYENTANSMVFLAYNLAFHPLVQEKLQKEVDDIASADAGRIDFDTINGMKYLSMCINESLRLYQPLLANARICRKETTICGLTIPKNMTVNIPTFALSRDPEFWDDPLEFNPDRMEDMSQIDPMVFQPFGAGPRNCIGLRFALMEIKTAFFKIMQKYTFEPCENTPKPPLELAFGLGLRSAKQFELRAVPRSVN